MKAIIIPVSYNNSEDLSLLPWYFIADSAVTNKGKPFYIPDGESLVDLHFGIAVRVSRLGKTIAKKFAPRYYSEIAPAIHFTLPLLEAELLKAGFPTDKALSFDRSLIYGDFISKENIETLFPLNLIMNGRKIFSLKKEYFLSLIDDIISGVSTLNTLKMGDFIIPAFLNVGKVNIGDKIIVEDSYGNELISVRIK